VFEITTLRKDVETDGRHAVVAFSDSWEEDAQRRDFTINTLLADIEGNIFDPTGEGLEDLEARRVRFAGDAEQRIKEDYLRILRFFRFHAFYGAGEMDEAALEACAKFGDKVESLSKERVTNEFLKILSVDNPVDVLRVMRDNAIYPLVSSCGLTTGSARSLKDPAVEPQGDIFDGVEKLCTLQNEHNLLSLPARMMVLGIDTQAFILTNVFKKEMQAIGKIMEMPFGNEHDVKVAMYRYGREAAGQGILALAAQGEVNKAFLIEAMAIIKTWKIPEFPIKGEDLIKEGIPQGPALGEELKRREQAWIDGGFS